jgi:hypothetical protein
VRHRANAAARMTARLVGHAMVAPTWKAVRIELDCWTAWGRRPVFWWRDDDATHATAALDRLLEIQRRFDVPLALSVIPAHADRSLARRLRLESRVFVLQHGWNHVNHAGSGRRAAELCDFRDPVEVRAQLANGLERLDELFGGRVLPVLVPPYNRLAAQLTPIVAAAYRFLSVHGDFPGIAMPSRNTHIDIIDWRLQQSQAPARLIRTLVTALRLRRYGILPVTLPLGILTHHLSLTTSMWSSLEAILEHICSHTAPTFPGLMQIFCEGANND